MPQSSDLSQLTLEKAAEFLAITATIGVARAGREKTAMSAGATGALWGGGLGLGAGLLSSMGDEEKRKHWLRRALSGAALGAGVGGAAGFGKTMYDTYQQKSPAEIAAVEAATATAQRTQNAANAAKAERQYAKATGGAPLTDKVRESLQPVLDKLGLNTSPPVDGDMPATPASSPASSPGFLDRTIPGNPDISLREFAKQWTSRPVETLALGGAGVLAGNASNKLQEVAGAGQGTLSRLQGMTADEIKNTFGKAHADVAAKYQEAIVEAAKRGGKPVYTADGGLGIHTQAPRAARPSPKPPVSVPPAASPTQPVSQNLRPLGPPIDAPGRYTSPERGHVASHQSLLERLPPNPTPLRETVMGGSGAPQRAARPVKSPVSPPVGQFGTTTHIPDSTWRNMQKSMYDKPSLNPSRSRLGKVLGYGKTIGGLAGTLAAPLVFGQNDRPYQADHSQE